MDKPIDPYYQKLAKETTNFFYDKGFLADDLSREGLDILEDYLAFILNFHCDLAAKAAILSKKVRDQQASQ